uniref:Uncharacterized protein n=1 Tax=Arundo donax TaxID=35708 RepID=A0A0A9GKW5_ARUDO
MRICKDMDPVLKISYRDITQTYNLEMSATIDICN